MCPPRAAPGPGDGRRSPFPPGPPPCPMIPSLFYALALAAAQFMVGPADICDDCNYPVDDGCKCVCYSGGYDPNDPACQF